ncbi:MAG TPA: hypothetical protein DIT10_10515 [Chryseobacterium sp.]|nr:hypothetical protein [Chryseobacterium sp.]
MKNVITSFSVVIILLASCSPATDKKVNKVDSTAAKTDTVSRHTPEVKTVSKVEVPGDFSELVPIDVLDTKNENVYEKYGIEFSGNCYSCDLASLSITENTIKWTNICDEKDVFEVSDFSVSGEGSKTVLKTADRTYILTQIDKAPVYELVIEGQKLELNNKRIAKYFTTRKALPLFKEHDCGDFEG